MKQHLFLLTFLSFLFYSEYLNAQVVADPNFATNGIKTINLTINGSASTSEYFNATLIQPDGKILLAGKSDSIPSGAVMVLTRLNKDGSFDASFNGGVVKKMQYTGTNYYNEIKAIALQPDGKILVTGSTGSGGSYVSMFLWRFNTDGTKDASFNAAHATYGGYGAIGTSVFFDNVNNQILVSSSTYSSSVRLTVYRFNMDGTIDNNFGTAGSYTYSAATTTNGTGIIRQSDGSIIISGNYSLSGTPYTQYFMAQKLTATGALDVSFNSTGVNNSIQFVPSAFCGTTSMLLLSGGKILLGGWTNTTSSTASTKDFAFAMLKQDGSYDASFGNAATPGRVTFDIGGNSDVINVMSVQPDGKIVASGTSGGSIPIVIRMDATGKLDNTFGSSGIFKLPIQGAFNGADIDLSTGTIALGGGDATNVDLMAARLVNLFVPQKVNILGKQIVSIETENTYHINPVISGYQYTWTYSNSDIYVLGANTNDSVTLYFRNTTPSGTLTCNVFNGGKQIYTTSIPIQVNPEPTLAQQLVDPACTPAQSTCDLAYISSVQITKTHADGTGCSPSGYSDLTAISNYDTLYKGDNYGALVIHGGLIGNNTYCGIWVDLDNNGVINPTKEFVGSGLSTNSEIKVNNIFIPSDVELGPKRLRVRIRNGSPFTADDFCIANNDLGETQDYLIVMQAYQDFQAPNFITPNNDGKNDYFIIHGVKSEQTNELKVYSKAGDLVYETEHYDNQWGGRNKSNELLTKGTYYYVFIKDPSSNDSKNVERGFFEIRY